MMQNDYHYVVKTPEIENQIKAFMVRRGIIPPPNNLDPRFIKLAQKSGINIPSFDHSLKKIAIQNDGISERMFNYMGQKEELIDQAVADLAVETEDFKNTMRSIIRLPNLLTKNSAQIAEDHSQIYPDASPDLKYTGPVLSQIWETNLLDRYTKPNGFGITGVNKDIKYLRVI
jgi:hypothetical protein